VRGITGCDSSRTGKGPGVVVQVPSSAAGDVRETKRARALLLKRSPSMRIRRGEERLRKRNGIFSTPPKTVVVDDAKTAELTRIC